MKKKITLKEHGIKPSGMITLRAYKSCRCATSKKFGHCRHKLGGKYRPQISVVKQHNLIMQGSNIGKDMLVQWLLTSYYNAYPSLGITPIAPGINYGAIGTGSTTPTATDTKLATESARTTVALGANASHHIAQMQFYFPDSSLSNITYREFGTFVGGTASADSGYIFNRALFATPYTKSAGTDITVQVDITLS